MFSVLSPNELRSTPPPVEWVVKNLVARGKLTLLAGEGGLGKSSLSLALCAAVANGATYYGGMMIYPGSNIAYVDGENSRDEIHRRANAFKVYEDIYQFEGDMNESTEGLRKVCDRVAGGMVVLDSFRSLFPMVDENSTKDVMPALKTVQHVAREFNVGVVILHHTSKAGVYRGSTSFRDTPDVVCTLKRDSGLGARYIDWNKMRIGIEPDRHHMKIAQIDGSMHWEQAYAPIKSATWEETWDDTAMSYG